MADGMDLGGASFLVTANTQQIEAALTKTEQRARRFERTVKDSMTHVAAETQKGSSKAAQGILALSYAIDDMQYGFRSIVNNIPQVALMFGAGAGLAGAVGIAGVAVNVLMNHWDSLINSFQSQWLNVPFEQLEKLRIVAEKADEAFEKLVKTPKAIDVKQINAINAAITEEGPMAVMKGLTQAAGLEPSIQQDVKQERDETRKKMLRDLEFLFAGMPGGIPADEIAKMDRQLNEIMANTLQKKSEVFAKDIMGKAMLPGEEGQGARATLYRMIQKFRSSFTEKFLKAMSGTTVQAIENMAHFARIKMEDQRIEQGRAMDHALGAQMIQGPLGRQMMMMGLGGGGGAAGGGGAGGAAAARRPISKKDVIKRALEIERKEGFAGMTPEMMRAVQGGMIPPEMLGDVQMRMGPLMVEARKRMMKEQADQMAKAPKAPPDDPMVKAVGEAMKAAGIVGDPKGVLDQMKGIQEEHIRALMLERGMTREQAQREILRQNVMHQFPHFNQPAQFVGIADFAKKIQIGALGVPDVQKAQLSELQQIRMILAKQPAPGAAKPAVAAGPP
jgi:hypothetical protein